MWLGEKSRLLRIRVPKTQQLAIPLIVLSEVIQLIIILFEWKKLPLACYLSHQPFFKRFYLFESERESKGGGEGQRGWENQAPH